MAPYSDPTTRPRRRMALSVVSGLTIAALILVSGLFWVFTRSHDWSAKATTVVLPAPGIPAGTAASYYDTLSRGQIVETYAETLRLTAKTANVTVSVVPNTALITITATAKTGTIAESLADGVYTQTSQYIRSLSQPYILNSVSGAKGTATETTSHTGGFLAVLLVVAFVVGLGVQQAVSQLVNARSKTVSPPAQPPAPQVAPAARQEPYPPFAPPTPTAPPQPAPAVRPTVADRQQRQRWPAEPAEPVGNSTTEPAGNGTAETAAKSTPEPTTKNASEPTTKSTPEPTGKGASEPAGKSASGSGRVEDRTPEP